MALPLTQLPCAILQVCIAVQVSVPLWASSPGCSPPGEVSSPGLLRLAAQSPPDSSPHTASCIVWLTAGFEPRSLAQNPNSILPPFSFCLLTDTSLLSLCSMLGPVLGMGNIRETQPLIVGSICSVNTQAHQSIRQFQKEEGAVLKADRVW